MLFSPKPVTYGSVFRSALAPTFDSEAVLQAFRAPFIV